jgi:hypothetical protein
MLVKDIHITLLLFHIIICFIYSHYSLTIAYSIFVCIIGILSMFIGSISAQALEQKKLYN